MADKKDDKKEWQKLKEKLAISSKSAWETLEKAEEKKVFELADDYKEFLRAAKTEREIVAFASKLSQKHGFVSLEKAAFKPKEKIWAHNRHRNLVLIKMGSKGLAAGLRVVVSHIDALRLDLKANPFYEDAGMALINLHYYGGIKKYHWVNVPLALHGIVYLKNGEKLEISLGEKETEPVFAITDLLPHVGGKAFAEKKASDLVPGEQLDAVGATIPLNEKDAQDKIKLRLLQLLNQKYGLVEEDFFSAELQLLPAVQPRDVGFDASLIGAYAHDDRACSYTAMRAMLDSANTEHTALVVFMDREEIGSTGATGSESFFLENLVDEIARHSKSNATAREILAKSYFLSADVTSALDPKYREFFDPTNVSMIGHGVSIERESGYGGKYEGSDASAEFLSFLRTLFNKHNVVWQTGEISKVDEGGGGTVAQYFAKYGCEIADVGPPVLAMHSPFELVSKVDLFMAYKGYRVFLES